MRIETISILGGTGFVGSWLANKLAARGYNLRIFTRDRERARHLWLLPKTDCSTLDVYDEAALTGALMGCDAAINLVGILNERGDDGAGFRRAHVALTATVLAACRGAGVSRLLHMSALNADPAGPSHYLRTKGEAERHVLEAAAAGLQATVFRPSVIFGPGDGLFNRFARLLRYAPVLPLACAASRFQPVYVGDVAVAFVRALEDRATYGARYDLAGPDVWSLRQIVDYVVALLGKPRIILSLGPRLSRAQAEIFEFLPGKPFSRDNYRSASQDNVCTGPNGLTVLGIPPTPIAAVVPAYLSQRRERRRYDALRANAGR